MTTNPFDELGSLDEANAEIDFHIDALEDAADDAHLTTVRTLHSVLRSAQAAYAAGLRDGPEACMEWLGNALDDLEAMPTATPEWYAADAGTQGPPWPTPPASNATVGEPAEAEGATSESEDRQALDHICQFLCRIGGWDEIDGDGDEGSIIVDHIGRILDPPWAESAEGASTCEQINGVTP